MTGSEVRVCCQLLGLPAAKDEAGAETAGTGDSVVVRLIDCLANRHKQLDDQVNGCRRSTGRGKAKSQEGARFQFAAEALSR